MDTSTSTSSVFDASKLRFKYNSLPHINAVGLGTGGRDKILSRRRVTSIDHGHSSGGSHHHQIQHASSSGQLYAGSSSAGGGGGQHQITHLHHVSTNSTSGGHHHPHHQKFTRVIYHN